MQWRYRGPEPLGNTKPDGDIIVELMYRVQKKLDAKKAVFPAPIKGFNLEGCSHKEVFDPHAVAKLINGYFLKDVTIKDKQFKKGDLVPSFAFLQSDGSTSSGNWLYCGSYTGKGNMSARRDKAQTKEQANIGLYPNWSWCWPVNRRILYNRASVDMQGKPWAPQKAVIAWDGKKMAG